MGLVACDGGSDSHSSTQNSTNTNQPANNSNNQQNDTLDPKSTIKARFIDSAVKGLDIYQDGFAGKSGIGYQTSDKNGNFYFSPNTHKVVFKVGEVTLGEVVIDTKTAKRDADNTIVVTPTDIAKNPQHETKILQVLQSLDKDNDPNNGIELVRDSSQPKAIGTLPEVNLADDKVTVVDTLKSTVLPVNMVSEDRARKHYEETIASLQKKIEKLEMNTASAKDAIDKLVGTWRRDCKQQATNSYDIATFTIRKVNDTQITIAESYQVYKKAGCTGTSKSKNDGGVYKVENTSVKGSTIQTILSVGNELIAVSVDDNSLRAGDDTFTRISH